jgi:hypothetical protein
MHHQCTTVQHGSFCFPLHGITAKIINTTTAAYLLTTAFLQRRCKAALQSKHSATCSSCGPAAHTPELVQHSDTSPILPVLPLPSAREGRGADGVDAMA